MVNFGIWSKMDQGRLKAILFARAERVIEGTQPHTAQVHVLWLSDHTNSFGLQMGPGQSPQLGRCYCTKTNVNYLRSVGF